MEIKLEEVIDAQASELGILSSQVIVSALKIKAAAVEIKRLTEQEDNLRIRLASLESDMKILRAKTLPANHPDKRKK